MNTSITNACHDFNYFDFIPSLLNKRENVDEFDHAKFNERLLKELNDLVLFAAFCGSELQHFMHILRNKTLMNEGHK